MFLVVTPLEGEPPLEVLPSVISSVLGVIHCWDVVKVSGVWAIYLVEVIQVQPFLVVRPAIFWYVLVVPFLGSVVDYLSVSIPT